MDRQYYDKKTARYAKADTSSHNSDDLSYTVLYCSRLGVLDLFHTLCKSECHQARSLTWKTATLEQVRHATAYVPIQAVEEGIGRRRHVPKQSGVGPTL